MEQKNNQESLSQSLIHQVLDSHVPFSSFLQTGILILSQSLIHQVLDSHSYSLSEWNKFFWNVAIPYSSGLRFSQ